MSSIFIIVQQQFQLSSEEYVGMNNSSISVNYINLQSGMPNSKIPFTLK